MHRRHFILTTVAAGLLTVGLAASPAVAGGSDVPAAGQSAKIDAIKARGSLKAAAIGEFPWLPENTSGSGDQFSGPAWVLANEFASRLGVKLEIVPQGLILLLKFLAAPALAWWLCRYIELPQDVTSVVVVASATPVGVLLAVFAAEYDREPQFISTAVVVSTALSPFVVTAWVLATRLG